MCILPIFLISVHIFIISLFLLYFALVFFLTSWNEYLTHKSEHFFFNKGIWDITIHKYFLSTDLVALICRIFIINQFKIFSNFHVYLTLGYWACFLISKHMRFLLLLHCVQRTCSVHFSSLKFIETYFVAQHMVSFLNRTVDTPLTNPRAPHLQRFSLVSPASVFASFLNHFH